MERLTIWDVPGEIAVPWDNRNSCDDICKEVGGECERCVVNECFNKLAEYEDAEDDGRIAKLPCKVGDTLYYLSHEPTGVWVQQIKVEDVSVGGCFKDALGSWHSLKNHYSIYEEAEEAKQKELEADNGREDQADS